MLEFDSYCGKRWMITALLMLIPDTIFIITWIVLEYIIRGPNMIAVGRGFAVAAWVNFVLGVFFFIFGTIVYIVETKKETLVKISKKKKKNKK